MKVLYNAMGARSGGGLSYARGQVAALAGVENVDLTVLTSPWSHEAIDIGQAPNVVVHQVRVPNVAIRFLWEQTVLPWTARHHDVLVSPGNFGPLLGARPQALILQNVNHVGRGRQMSHNTSARRWAKIALSQFSMRRADLVVAISEVAAAEIRLEPKLRSVEVVTVRTGSPTIDPPDARCDRSVGEALDRLVGSEPFVVSVANDAPHKRLDDLARLLPAMGSAGAVGALRVVLVGAVAEKRRSALRQLAGAEADRLVFLGSIADRSTVLALYRRATVAITTSELEAFGMTLHEALSQGTPLVASDIPAHREQGAGRARFFPIGDVVEMAAAVVEAMSGPRPDPWVDPWNWSDHAEELVVHLSRLVRDG